MSTNKQATLLTVHERTENPKAGIFPSFIVKGGTVNVYHANKAKSNSDAPADKSEMQLDSNSPFAADVHSVEFASDYILWETATGSPVITTKNLIK